MPSVKHITYTQFKGKLVRGVFCTCRKIPHLLKISSFYKNLPSSDPVSMTSVIAVVIALLIIFLVLVISLLIAYKKQKLCFQGRNSDTQLADSHPPVAPPSLVGRCYSSPLLLLQGGLYLGFSVIRGKLVVQPNIISRVSRDLNFFNHLTHLVLF